MRDKVKEILEQLEDGVKEVFNSEKYKNYLKTMSNFHNYSFNNSFLICMQKPDSTLVAGFNTWKKLKRNVSKGEKGIAILAPCSFNSYIEKEKVDPVTNKPIINRDTGEIEKVKVPVVANRFKIVYVFDISQTSGEPVPSLVDELKGNINEYNNFIESLKMISDFPIEFIDMSDSSKGYCDFNNKVIAIKKGMDEKQVLKTAIHEIAHSMLHGKDNGNLDRRTAEVQAESIAFVVCNYYGIDTKDYSFAYVASWSKGKDIKELKNSLSVIQRTSNLLINKINGMYKELTRSKEVVKLEPGRKSLKDISKQIEEYKKNTPYINTDSNIKKEFIEQR